jgi:glycosyltransferase 2 family protein
MLLVTAGLLWVSLSSLDVGEEVTEAGKKSKTEVLWETWTRADKGYLFSMAVAIVISHLLRAMRWRILLAPTRNHISLTNSFLSVMVGYLINLVIPRGGEVSRCYNLYKLENTPVETSFGTVIFERIIDVLFLVAIILLSFVMEWSRLEGFIATLDFSAIRKLISPWMIIAAILLLISGSFAVFYFIRKNEKLKKLFEGFKEGLFSIFQLQQKALFIFYSVAIWVLYFLMSYFVIKAFPETSPYGLSAVMVLFALGSIAMSVPLPGGAGSYHTIVPLGLVMIYHLPKADATAFVFIFHALQTLVVIMVGLISLLATYAIIRWRKPQIK